MEDELLFLDEKDLQELLVRNDTLVGFIFKCTKEQVERIFPELCKVFPNIYLIRKEVSTPDDRLFIVSKKKLQERKRVKLNGDTQ